MIDLVPLLDLEDAVGKVVEVVERSADGRRVRLYLKHHPDDPHLSVLTLESESMIQVIAK